MCDVASLTRWLVVFSVGELPPCPTDVWDWFEHTHDPDDLPVKMIWRAMLLANKFDLRPEDVERYFEPEDPLEKAVWRALLACGFDLPDDPEGLADLAELVRVGMPEYECPEPACLWAVLRGVNFPPAELGSEAAPIGLFRFGFFGSERPQVPALLDPSQEAEIEEALIGLQAGHLPSRGFWR